MNLHENAMKVRVKLFAAAKQAAGSDSVEVDVSDRSTVGNLREALSIRFPELRTLLRHAMFAINAEYVATETPLHADQEIACIPPVSGG